MKTIRFIFLNVLAISIFLSCNNEPEINFEQDNYIKAIGSKNNVDKEKWGNFNFVLQLDKQNYSIGEQIYVLTYFANIGNKTITLDGILPYRQSASPPTVEIQLNDTLIFRTNNLLNNLNNKNNIVIKPNRKVELNKFNLLEVEGQLMVLDKKSNLYHNIPKTSIESFLSKKGSFQIHAFFHPTPQIYCSNTDTLTITIQ